MTRLRFGFTHLINRKFIHGLQDMLIPFCSCGNDIESTYHYILYCPHYSNEKITFMEKCQR